MLTQEEALEKAIEFAEFAENDWRASAEESAQSAALVSQAYSALIRTGKLPYRLAEEV